MRCKKDWIIGMPRNRSHHRWLHAQLQQWQSEGLISNEIAASIRQRYPEESVANKSRLSWMTVILGIFGSILITGGIILIFAHNWHDLSRSLRTAIAITPLIVFQALGIWTLARRPRTTAWQEGIAAGLTLSIGAAIALIAQTYQLGGDFGRFMLVWTLLTLPILYALRSGTALWLYLTGTVIYAGYLLDGADAGAPGFYLLYLAAVLFVIRAHLNADHPLLAVLGRYALAIAFWVGFPLAFDYRWDGAWLPTMTAAAGAMFLWDRPVDGRIEHLHRHPFSLTAALFAIGILAVFSFEDAWQGFGRSLRDSQQSSFASLALIGIIAVIWGLGMIRWVRLSFFWPVLLGGALPALATIGWLMSGQPNASSPLMLATNATGLALGVLAIFQALREDRLSLLNYGLILVGGLVLLRFFDSDLGFVVRGLGFIGLGIAFLVANFLFVRHRRSQSNDTEAHS